MGNQFKVGDLAMTKISIPALPAGSVVELVEAVNKDGFVHAEDGQVFIAVQDGWLCRHPLIDRSLAYAESSLMPLRGDFEPEQHKQREAEPCA